MAAKLFVLCASVSLPVLVAQSSDPVVAQECVAAREVEEVAETSLLQKVHRHAQQIQGPPRQKQSDAEDEDDGDDDAEDEDDEECHEEFKVFPYDKRDQEVWAENYEGWQGCAGKLQSPVDISASPSTVKDLKLSFNFTSSAGTLNNHGHSIQAEPDGEDYGSISFGNESSSTRFDTKQFHFHTPSEHTLNGTAAPAEMHIVNFDGQGAFTVIGVLFQEGEKNECLEKVLGSKCRVPKAGCHRSLGEINLDCFNDQLTGPFFNYPGSLTTPPCTEAVNWVVMLREASASKEQLECLHKRFPGGDARITQPLNGRKVVEETA